MKVLSINKPFCYIDLAVILNCMLYCVQYIKFYNGNGSKWA